MLSFIVTMAYLSERYGVQVVLDYYILLSKSE
jgi:hypothetical protein